MSEDKAIVKCTEERYCDVMTAMYQLGPSRARGLQTLVYSDIATGKITRSLVVYKTYGGDPGTVLNFCPWCGASVRFDVTNER